MENKNKACQNIWVKAFQFPDVPFVISATVSPQVFFFFFFFFFIGQLSFPE
jgi:hypothetical protein